MFAMRELPNQASYKKGDVMVVFGELFSRGYANGIVEEAQRQGLKVIFSTVGRRDEQGQLRALTQEELKEKSQPLINIPMEAGFDMEPDDQGLTPCDQLKGLKMSDWDKDHLNWDSVLQSQRNGQKRFAENCEKYMQELESHIPEGSNVLFVHIMAGGVPRTKVIMPVMNKVFKGRGERFIPSQALFESQLGRFSQLNFTEVTANTFRTLIESSQSLRQKIESKGKRVSYLAYGYHGTEVLVDGRYQWQTYTPYFQGWAKMELESIATEYFKKGVSCAVFNCPEILTNSSSIFQGVEVSLYPLLGAIAKEGESSQYCQNVLATCRDLLKPEHQFSEIMNFTSQYIHNPLTKRFSDYASWPQHNAMEQMAYMLDCSDHLINMHKDPKDLMTFPLSEEVFKSTGYLMYHVSDKIPSPVIWLNHDIVAKQMAVHP